MRRISVYFSLFILLCFMGDISIKHSIAKQINDQSPYCLSFASIGANLLESRLDCWAKIKSVRTFAAMDQELSQILTLLDLPIEEQNFKHQSNNGIRTLSYELNQHNQKYLLIIQTESESEDSYFLLTAISPHNDKRLRGDEQKLKTALNCQSYYRYQGVINAHLDKASREKLMKVAIKSMQAQKVDRFESGSLISAAGLSSKFKTTADTVQIGNKAYNFQLALSSDRKNNKTNIYLGVPLLLNDY